MLLNCSYLVFVHCFYSLLNVAHELYAGPGMIWTKEFPHLQMIPDLMFLRTMLSLHLTLVLGIRMKKHVAVITRTRLYLKVENFIIGRPFSLFIFEAFKAQMSVIRELL